ncbi:hypothetical protein GGQ82_004214 [Sphingobium olei]
MSLLRLPSFQPLRREFEVFLCRCLRLFLERMKHQNPVFQRRQIDHPERARRFPDANFPNALPHGFHGLPVVGIVAALDKLKLPTGICSRIFGEGANIGLATSQPLYRLHEAGCIKTETLIQAPSPWAFGGWDLRLPLRGTVALLAALPKPASGLGPR